MIIDDIRAKYPNLGICIYAIVPREPATLEVFDPSGATFQFTAPTVAECLEKAFPELTQPELTADMQLNAEDRAFENDMRALHAEPAEPEPEAPAANVFD